MPGDVVICTWNDLSVNNETKCKTGFKSKDEEQTKKLSTLPGMPSYNDRISVWGSGGYREYRKFLMEKQIEKGIPIPIQLQEIEETCWTHSRTHYKDGKLPEHQTKKLWKVFNRLSNDEGYPPTVSRHIAEWLLENVVKLFTHDSTRVIKGVKADGLTFQEFQQYWFDNYIQRYTETAVENCIDQIYRWLVAEESKAGWMYRRIKKQSNWTSWVKSWFVLTPFKLTYYETPSDKKATGEIMLTPNVTVKVLPRINGVAHDFEDRFHVMDGPQNVTECRVKGIGEQTSWMTAIEAAKSPLDTESTPIQVLLHSLSCSTGPCAEEARKNIEAFLLKIMKMNITTVSESNQQTNSPDGDNRDDKTYDSKFKAAFYKIDTSGNGLIDVEEFSTFFKQLGLHMDEEGVKKIFNTIDVDNSGQLSLDEFTSYFTKMVLSEESSDPSEDCLRKAFIEADRDKTGCLDFKEFSDYVMEKKRNKRMDKVLEAFCKMASSGEGTITIEQFKELTRNHIAEDDAVVDPTLGNHLQKFFDDIEGEEIVDCIKDRWAVFSGFERYDKTGKLVMKGDKDMVADFVPGQYSLVDLACFSDLPPIEPEYRAVKFTWKSSTVKGKSGELIFPADFDGKIPRDIATNEHLRYYGCSFADSTQTKVSLLYRHGIQDFTYENAYLNDFVLETRGGAGLETHQFSHLDCPVDEDSGLFVLGKIVDGGMLHLTGFKVPHRHTLYLPGGTIHSNDYLKGTWRTMLSDETIIDHVVTVAKKDDSGELVNVTLTFH